MPSSVRVRRKRGERRQRIIEAAIVQIAHEGIAELSMIELARELDYTPGALYWYFSSKEAVILAAQSHVYSALSESLQRARQASQASPLALELSDPERPLFVVSQCVIDYLKLLGDKPEWNSIVVVSFEPRQGPELCAQLVDNFAAPLSEAMSLGALSEGNSRERAAQLWLTAHSALQARRLTSLVAAPRKLALDSTLALLRGWGASTQVMHIIHEKLSGNRGA